MILSNDSLQLVFIETTNDIKISVIPEFCSGDSNKEHNVFVWAYNVSIENLSQSTIQIYERYWKIYEISGRTEEVQGVGVVGEQPIIKVGEVFEYTSKVRLFSNCGWMEGRYIVLDITTGHKFLAKIPAFSLDITLSDTLMH